MRIVMHFNHQNFVFVLEDNVAARDLWNLLPLELTFSDYVGKEKIATLSQRLSPQESSNYDPQIGDFSIFLRGIMLAYSMPNNLHIPD